MVKGIPPPLYALSSTGHSDERVIADAEFPWAGIGRRVVHLPNTSWPDGLDTIFTMFRLDSFASSPALTMEVMNDPAVVSDSARDFAEIFPKHGFGDAEIGHLSRDSFCARARERLSRSTRW